MDTQEMLVKLNSIRQGFLSRSGSTTIVPEIGFLIDMMESLALGSGGSQSSCLEIDVPEGLVWGENIQVTGEEAKSWIERYFPIEDVKNGKVPLGITFHLPENEGEKECWVVPLTASQYTENAERNGFEIVYSVENLWGYVNIVLDITYVPAENDPTYIVSWELYNEES